MSLLNKEYLAFDEEDVELLKQMMSKFHRMHIGTGMPDFSQSYVGYLPVFIISLLHAQQGVDRLTKRLLAVTWVLTILTVFICLLTVVLIFRTR